MKPEDNDQMNAFKEMSMDAEEADEAVFVCPKCGHEGPEEEFAGEEGE